MFLSIIIPVYNTGKFISECLDSCLSQDIDKTDYEIICVDDCSTDNSFDILKKYEKQYANIRVFRTDVNSGVSTARNVGIDSMNGDFCWFIDSDDYIANNCLGEIKQIIKTGCDYLTVGQYKFKHKKGIDRSNCQEVGEYRGIISDWYLTNRIISRNLIGNIRFQSGIAYGEDEVFFFELKLKKPIVKEIDKPIYFYRLHEMAATHLTDEKTKKRIDSFINAAAYLVNKYKPYDEDTIGFIIYRTNAAFKAISILSFKDRVQKLRLMKNKGLISKRLNDNVIIGRRSMYIRLRLSIWKTRIKKIFHCDRQDNKKADHK